jgi:hypothetical protein
MSFWALVLPVLKRILPLPRLVRLTAPRRARSRGDRARERELVTLTNALYASGLVVRSPNCLERSLVAFRYLARSGADPLLVVGFRREENEVQGHVWVTVDGTPVADDLASLETYTRTMAFDRRGRAAATGPPS